MFSSLPKKLPPPKNYWQVVEEIAKSIPDPVRKLKFLKRVTRDRSQLSIAPDNDVDIAKTDSIDTVQVELQGEETGQKENKDEHLEQEIAYRKRNSHTWAYRYRHIIISAILVVTVWSAGMLLMSLIGVINTAIIDSTGSDSDKVRYYSVNKGRLQTYNPVATLKEKRDGKKVGANEKLSAYLNKVIWIIENTPDIEFYSNRLQIITTYMVDNIPRNYYKFPKNSVQLPAKDLSPKDMASDITGILYHASESDIFDYKPEMTSSIKRYSKALIKYLCKKKSYHYFIDRFGRVYRLVKDEHAAFHGGNSVWADDESIYLNLNHAFIGICFEGRDFETVDKSAAADDDKKGTPNISMMQTSSINEAQIRSGKELTDLLRVKYNISQHNCVPHSLASVNARSLLIGHHLDLSYGFPFNEYELSNKYNEPLPSITEFGFSYDKYFEKIFGAKKWPGISYSEELLKKQAKKKNLPLPEYRNLLNKKFIRFFEWKKEQMKNTKSVKDDQDNIKTAIEITDYSVV